MKKQRILLAVAVCLAVLLTAAYLYAELYNESAMDVPAFSGMPYVVLQNNQPQFAQEEMTCEPYEYYAPQDMLDRCSYAMACIGIELMPTEERGSIGQIKPSGWQTVKYDFVDGKYLYNRCHLIGYQLTGENANPRNLITGTRYLNIEGMLPFENMVADYIKETENHVMYRVTPVFHGNELVARGVQIEALSVEDNGAGICFNIYAYNNQPGVSIDYLTGESKQTEAFVTPEQGRADGQRYILNTNSQKFHSSDCGNGKQTKEDNKEYYTGTRQALIDAGYTPAGCCNP